MDSALRELPALLGGRELSFHGPEGTMLCHKVLHIFFIFLFVYFIFLFDIYFIFLFNIFYSLLIY